MCFDADTSLEVTELSLDWVNVKGSTLWIDDCEACMYLRGDISPGLLGEPLNRPLACVEK